MDPSTIYHFSHPILFITVLLSITLSLTRTIHTIVLKNIAISKQRTPLEEAVLAYSERTGFLEVVALGRIFFNTLIAIILWNSYLKSLVLFDLWPLDSLILFIAECFIIYTTCFLFPKILAHLKPYSLAPVAIWAFEVHYFLFYFPSRFTYAIFEKTLALFGYDSKTSFLTDNELKKLDAYTPSEKHSLKEDEKQMIKNIFEFGETRAKEIMIPRVEIIALDQNTDIETTIKILNDSRFSRIPIYQDNIDTIIGILSTKEFFSWFSKSKDEPLNLAKLASPPYFVTREKKIDDLMRELRKERTHIAIVVDEFGGTSGIVTLEDILEEIVGEIYDEDDENDLKIEKIKENIFFVNPIISLSDLSEQLGYHIVEPENIEVETLSGLIQATLGTVPPKGTSLTIGDIFIKVLKVDGPRLEKVLLRIGTDS